MLVEYTGEGSDCRCQALPLLLPLLLPPVPLWCQSSLKPERLVKFSLVDIYLSLKGKATQLHLPSCERAVALTIPAALPTHKHCRPASPFFSSDLGSRTRQEAEPFGAEIKSQTSLKSSPIQELSLKMLPSSTLQDSPGVKCLPWKEGCFPLPTGAHPHPGETMWGEVLKASPSPLPQLK